MVVERVSYRVKHEHKREFIELVKALVAAAGVAPRVCSSIYGDTGVVTSDLEFETEEDQHKFWSNFDFSMPEYVEFMDKFADMTETGYIHELWRVH
jgi:hypothetical protein